MIVPLAVMCPVKFLRSHKSSSSKLLNSSMNFLLAPFFRYFKCFCISNFVTIVAESPFNG